MVKPAVGDADNLSQRETTMILWMIAGYALSAVAFYSYIVKTAQDDPRERAATVIDMTEWQRQKPDNVRRAA